MRKPLLPFVLGILFLLELSLSACKIQESFLDKIDLSASVRVADSLRASSPWRFMRAISPAIYTVYHTTDPIIIDGVPDDSAWEKASFSDEFVDIEGAAQPNPSQRTRFKMLWDQEYLYIAGFIEETDLWATITRQNEVIYYDNDFEVFLDPDGDQHNYHELELNALNTRWELTLRRPYRDGGPYVDPDNLAGLLSAVHLDGTLNDASDSDVGWTVEIAMPWERLRQFDAPNLPPQRDDRWRINFSRVQWDLEPTDTGYQKITGHKEHNWVWSPIGIIDMHRPERWGWIQFADEDSAQSNVIGRASPLPLSDEMHIRDALMEIYYLAAVFRSHAGQYPERLADLYGSDSEVPTDVTLTPSPRGYIVRAIASEQIEFFLNQRGRIWRKPAHDHRP